jgi:murein DD-endopeptidase MepM/ murein hydrolase activator NlpD
LRRSLVALLVPLASPVASPLASTGADPPSIPHHASASPAADAVSSPSRRLAWPLDGLILRGFELPSSPYASGHRGIDIGAPDGTTVHAAAGGVVRFAGSVAGSLFVSLDHDGGLQTTYSWVSRVDVARGDPVDKGDPIALSGEGHPGDDGSSHLHFGVKQDGAYADPLDYLGAFDVSDLIHLAPLPRE